MYQKIDEAQNTAINSSDKLISAIETDNLKTLYENIYNAFEVCWDFDKFREIFKLYPHKAVFLSGSGPTVCALFDNEQDALNTTVDLKNRGYEANFAFFTNSGCEIE